MTRLFGCVCNQPKKVFQALEPVRAALVARPTVERWGLGYVQAGHVLLSRNPRGGDQGGGLDFGDPISRLQSDYIVGWAGVEDGLRGTPNTQPFRFRAWIYAQTASRPVGDTTAIFEHVPGYLQRNIRGKTEAEVFFNLFLSLLHDAGTINDPDMKAGTIREALRDTTALIARLLDCDPAERIGNVVVCNSRSMVIARLGEEPVFVRQLLNQDPRLSENDRYRAILAVSAREKPGDGFEAIPVGSAVVIHREVMADIEPITSPGN